MVIDSSLIMIIMVTCCAIRTLVRVKNWVTRRATLAGMDDNEMRKLIRETMIIAMQGR